MSVQAMTWAWDQKCPSPEAKLLLLRLCDGVDMDGRVRPGRMDVADDCGLSPLKVERLVGKMVLRGILRWKQGNLFLALEPTP